MTRLLTAVSQMTAQSRCPFVYWLISRANPKRKRTEFFLQQNAPTSRESQLKKFDKSRKVRPTPFPSRVLETIVDNDNAASKRLGGTRTESGTWFWYLILQTYSSTAEARWTGSAGIWYSKGWESGRKKRRGAIESFDTLPKSALFTLFAGCRI